MDRSSRLFRLRTHRACVRVAQQLDFSRRAAFFQHCCGRSTQRVDPRCVEPTRPAAFVASYPSAARCVSQGVTSDSAGAPCQCFGVPARCLSHSAYCFARASPATQRSHARQSVVFLWISHVLANVATKLLAWGGIRRALTCLGRLN